MVQRVVRIGPLSVAKVSTVIYGVFGILSTFAWYLPLLLGKNDGRSILLGLTFPPLYIALGFVGSAASAWLYNVVAAWVGGIEVVIEASDT